MRLLNYILSVSIYTKLAVMLIFMVLSIFTSTIIISMNISKEQTQKITDKLIQSNINTNNELISRLVLEKDYWSMYKYLKALSNNEVIKEIGITDNNHTILAYSNPKKYKSGAVFTPNESYKAFDIINNNIVLGKFIVIVDESDISEIIEKTFLNSLSYVTITGLFFFFIGYLFLKRIINRLQVVMNNMYAISKKNWDDIQYDLSGEKDELNDLVSQSIDTMHAIKDSIQRENTLQLFYRNVLNSMDSLIIICDNTMNIQYHNNHFLGQDILNETRTQFKDFIALNFKSDKKYSFTLKLHSARFLLFNILMIENKILINISDITTLKKAEENDKVLHSLELVRDVSSQFAHEIKNLLQPLALLIPKNKVPDKEDLPIIHTALSKMKLQVSDYLQLGRPIDLESTQEQYPYVIVQELLQLLKNKLQDKQLQVLIEVDENLSLKMNKKYIELILINLITNAIEAAFDNSEIKITWKSISLEESLLTIQNSGENIKDVSKIFKPFFTTKKEGSGLGLFTIYKIVYTAQGRIDVSSDKHQTLFNIYLPKGNVV